jgi:hypothetical protein
MALRQISFVAPVTSEQSRTLHDLFPVVCPTGSANVQGIPSDPIVHAASLRYSLHLAL